MVAAGRLFSAAVALYSCERGSVSFSACTPVLVDRALPLVTSLQWIIQRRCLARAAQIIAALPGMTPSALKEFLSQRPALSETSLRASATLGGYARNSQKHLLSCSGDGQVRWPPTFSESSTLGEARYTACCRGRIWRRALARETSKG